MSFQHLTRGPLTAADFDELASCASARCCGCFLDGSDRATREADTFEALTAHAGSLRFWEQLRHHQERLDRERLERQQRGDQALAAFAAAWLEVNS